MAISVASTTTSAYSATADSSITFTKPSGLSEGDVLVSAVCIDTVSQTVQTKTGWTSVGAGSTGFSKLYMKVQYKVADSSDVAATDFTFNYSGSASGDFGILYRIADTTNDARFDDSDTDQAQTETEYSFTTSLTPDTADSIVILTFAGYDSPFPTIANPTTTPSLTFSQDYNDDDANNIAFATFHASKSDQTEITAYGVDSSDGDAPDSRLRGVISVFNQVVDESGTTALLTATTTLNDGDGSAGTNGNANMAAAGTDTFNVAGTAEQEIWTNQNRSSTTWTNQNKS